ncbi:acetyl-CoA carboxylase biotin carboxyl carrier protein [Evansella tamaricis]|uniref:Biotin carboxyl carrier protein of acetyl-CoA carboxylase n=1 Tax=Evansella tamaricis TaxID=2069301 RepID=A0ABS6JIB3_9BACI|nr:acetyl-CoA carboxylase biotin carboxyl carrier protein [Evansella tamaricis]MBU9712205.1 acetyl-CoA carboxylase biotin carboxyl carrier protein [Evansella tamaricis]
MLKIQEIRELIKLIDDSTINEFKYEQNGSKITMRKQVETVQGPAVREQYSPQQVSAPVVTEVTNTQPKAVNTVTEGSGQEGNISSSEVRGNVHTITSPMVGTFYAAPSPDSDPYVKLGDKVANDSIVCIVEAMKLMNEIEAEVKGEVVEILVENGQLVEYGQELFLVKPE